MSEPIRAAGEHALPPEFAAFASRMPRMPRKPLAVFGRLGCATLAHVVIAMLVAATATVRAPAVRAQSATQVAVVAASHDFALPASDLSQALLQVGGTAGIRVVFDPQSVQGLHTIGIQGRFTVEEALQRLLQGTGLAHRYTDGGTVVLEQAAGAGRAGQAAGQASESLPVDGVVATASLNEVVVTATPDDDILTKDQTFQEARSTSVLSRDDIERFRGTSVGDIFKGSTGVLVGENRNSGGLDINIRGMQGQGRVPILVDGARQETTVYRGYSGVSSRSYIDPDLIGGIQIDKGPVMSADGTGATGGLVSMRTINADDIAKPGKSFGLRLRGQAIGNTTGSPMAADTPAGLPAGLYSGSSNATYRTDCATPSLCSGQYALPTEWGNPEGLNRPSTFDFKNWAGSIAAARRWEKIDLVAAYAQRRQGNYYAGEHGPGAWVDTASQRKLPFYTEVYPTVEGASVFQTGERIPGTNFESKSGLLKGKLFLPADQELELSYLRYSSVYSEIMPSQILRALGTSYVTQPRNSDVVAQTYTSRYRWNPYDRPLVDLRVNLWHTRTKSTNNSPSDTEVGLYNNDLEQYRRTGFDLSNTSTVRHPGNWGESQLRYGLAVQREDVGTTQLTYDVRDAGRDGDRQEYSVFAAWQYKPVQSITFDAGLRHTRFKSFDAKGITVYDSESSYCTDADGDGACDTLASRNKKSGTAPIVSLSWEPGNRGLQFYGRYAEAYRMPSLFESTSGYSFTTQPDINLSPEHARNKEFGINYLKDGVLRSNDKLRLKFAYFRNDISDYLTRTTANLWEEGGSTNSISTELVMRNIQSASFHGLELSGSYDLGAVFTEFGATKYNKIEVCHAGSYRVNPCNDYGIAGSYINNMVPPNWHGNLTLGTRLLQRKLTLGVRGIFMGKRNAEPEYNNDTSRSFLRVVPWHSYKVFDFFASYKVNDSLSVDFNLDNFTDRYYIDALSLGLIPAPGRTARLSATLTF
ncbi:TonB-dependent receptor [Corticibacter populi]|uniref:TonB-dependent receptor n=1 Tax=Corticibacter populi TaxID=1550736 RepID=A0A3M6QKB0_9BURK|nr:TonB-dependent receptor [Corticibacter populi]RMX03457.1 TonB-dependent receptor [Corticibacter populi]RZS29895.1 hemoglobin/transferrin/lactoferrin receptor protein [Corticibacter populi]